MERELRENEESAIQQNNGSPKGYGQPKKKNRRGVDRRVIMNDQAEQVAQFGPSAEYKQAYGHAQPALNSQVEDARRALTGGYPARNQMMPGRHQAQQSQPGLYDAFQKSVAAGYTDIDGAKSFGTGGQFKNQLQGFDTSQWGTNERGSNTLKNSFGKIASDYDVTQKGALQNVINDPRMQQLTGGKATIVEHPNQDLIDFDGPDGPMQPVDVITASQGGAGTGWWWGPQDEVGGGPMAPANQIYNNALQMPQLEGFNPQQAEGQAMQFLQWLLQQQQQGTLTNGALGNSPVMF